MTTNEIDDLAESFGLFDTWEDRYRYLIDLGRRLPPMDESLKTEERLVKGCTSRVWLASDMDADGKTFRFVADSDAQIVRGLVYILYLAYNDKPATEIPEIDIEKAFERMGLSGHLSPNRRNGFFAMVDHIKTICRHAG